MFTDDGLLLGLVCVSLQVVVRICVQFLSLLTGDLLHGSFQLQRVVSLLNVLLLRALMACFYVL